VDGKSRDFSPKSIGTETSPVESSDGTIAILHLICLTLPRVDEGVPESVIDGNVARYFLKLLPFFFKVFTHLNYVVFEKYKRESTTVRFTYRR
jgi:hypothetical protein